MNPILPTEETIEYEDRLYLNPQIGLDESNQFIENLRETQDNNIAQTQTQTQRLGTDVPSSLGGLTGPGSYFTSRYATPQNLSTLQNLRTAAQATALNQVLANEQAMWEKRYNDAYRAYQKRSWDKVNPSTNPEQEGEDPEYKSSSSTVDPPTVSGKAGYSTIVDPATGNIIDVSTESGEAEIREGNRYKSPEQAGYTLFGHPNRIGAPGAYVYNTPSGEIVRVELEDGYKIVYDTETGTLVQIKE